MNRWLCIPLLLGAASPLGAQAVDSRVAVRPSLGLSEMLDSASLHAALAAVRLEPPSKHEGRIFRIDFDTTGHPKRVLAAVPKVMPDRYREAVMPLLQAALRPIEPSSEGWRVLVLIEAGRNPRIEQVHLREAPARLANAGALYAALEHRAVVLVGEDSALVGKEFGLRLSMRVEEDGTMSGPRIIQSSGVPAVDDAAISAMRVIRFHPARLGNEPVSSQVILPIRFVFPAD